MKVFEVGLRVASVSVVGFLAIAKVTLVTSNVLGATVVSCGAAPTAGVGEPVTCAGRPSRQIVRVRRSQQPGADMRS
jgi:hypothetical protein